jgi:hypothetical protein
MLVGPGPITPSERLHAEVDEVFAGGADLATAVEQVARIGARLLLQTALEAEVSERRIDSSQREDLYVRAFTPFVRRDRTEERQLEGAADRAAERDHRRPGPSDQPGAPGP